jgi:putative methyltransferase (TIGR04325 family)
LLRWQHRQFLSKKGHGAYFGVFENFAAARASLPPNPEFDQAALAAEYVDIRTRKVFEYDYPMIVWLDHAFRDGASKVLDIGGSVGVHYYAYQKYLQMPAGLSWRVVEVPSMAKLGREMAQKTRGGALTFSEDLVPALSGSDIWIAAGSLQYFESARPGDLLKQCARRPRHILLNKIPLYAGEDFVTTQNIDQGSFTPLHVYNRRRYIREIEAMGYALEDQWPVHERSLYLPGHPEKSFPCFSGLYFVSLAVEEHTPEQRLSGPPAKSAACQPGSSADERLDGLAHEH